MAHLKGTTAIEPVLSFIFETAKLEFEIEELKRTGEILYENPLPYLH